MIRGRCWVPCWAGRTNPTRRNGYSGGDSWCTQALKTGRKGTRSPVRCSIICNKAVHVQAEHSVNVCGCDGSAGFRYTCITLRSRIHDPHPIEPIKLPIYRPRNCTWTKECVVCVPLNADKQTTRLARLQVAPRIFWRLLEGLEWSGRVIQCRRPTPLSASHDSVSFSPRTYAMNIPP